MAGTAIKVKSNYKATQAGNLKKTTTRKTHNKNVWGVEGLVHKTKKGRTVTPFLKTGNDEPLIQAGHEFFQPQLAGKGDSGFRGGGVNAPMPIDEVSDPGSGVVFTLTGGYIPTFTENFNHLRQFYRNYAGGSIVYNEAMTREGPGPMMMRGNHVWYNYAGDYLDRVGDIGRAAPKDGGGEPDIDMEGSMWDKIFDMYVGGSQNYIEPMMSTWREQLGLLTREKAKEYVEGREQEAISSEEMGAISRSDVQAPEEGLIQLLAAREGDISLATTGTTGGARGLDVQLMIAGELRQYDATQSKITSGQTHSGLGKLSLKINNAAEGYGDIHDQIEGQANTYFLRSQMHLNQMLMDLHTIAENARRGGKTGTTRDILRDLDFKTGDAWTGKYVDEQMLAQGIDNSKTKLVNAAGKEVERAYVAQAYDEAMHILGFATGLSNPVWTDQVGGRVPLDLGGQGNPVEMDFMATVDWRNEFSGAGDRLLQLELQAVEVRYDARMMIEVIMKEDLGYSPAQILRVIEDGNMLWNFHDMGLEGDNIAFNKLYTDTSMKLTGGGYHIAMGSAEFIEPRFNQELGKVLQEVVNDSVANPRQHTARIEKAMAMGQAQAMKFSRLWKSGAFDSGSLISASHQEPNQNQSEMLRWAEMEESQSKSRVSAAKGLGMEEEYGAAETGAMSQNQADYSSRLEMMNNLLVNYTWVMPYIGVHYQGGKSQKIEAMMASGTI